MKKRYILLLLLFIISISAVSAQDNLTVSDGNNITENIIVDSGDVHEDIGEVNNTGSDDIKENDEEIVKNTSEITTKNEVGYETFTTKITFNLASQGEVLSSKVIKIQLNNINYTKKTDKNGQANLNVKLPKGTYYGIVSYDGDENTTGVTKKFKITIKAPSKTSLKQGDKYINYRQGLKSLFYVKLVDINGKAIKNQNVVIKVNGKKYTVKTNSAGNAKVFLNLKKGTYTVKYSFTKNSPYLSSSGSCKIKVKAPLSKGNGYWVLSTHMKKVNLKSLAKKGTKQIFLHVHSIAVYGKSSVTNWIKKANKYGMHVHLWVQVFYKGGNWVKPCNPDGSIKYSYLNSKVKEVKKYSKIKGISGIHFDYVRFPGTAYKYSKSVDAVNYFVKKAATEIHNVKPNCVVSAAIMPEPSAMESYYGQDVGTMSKYLDVLLPMVYKGNYNQKTPWIKSVTKSFVSESNGAKIWTGLQSYKSDDSPYKLSQTAMLKDAKAAMDGGAGGVILFRYGISCNFNFKKL